MITLKDLTLLINHLHQANRIFDTEALIEERKTRNSEANILEDKRTHYAPRSVILHSKAVLVESLEKKLLEECDNATVPLEETTIYAARELVTESMYQWIHRREPPIEYMEDLMSDPTFIPYSHGLELKKKELLCGGLYPLLLPKDLEEDVLINTPHPKNVAIAISDIFHIGTEGLSSIFSHNKEYGAKLIIFRLYVLGLLEEDVLSEYVESVIAN